MTEEAPNSLRDRILTWVFAGPGAFFAIATFGAVSVVADRTGHVRWIGVSFDCAAFARALVILAAIPVSQFFVRELREFLQGYFELRGDPELEKAKNQRPQRVLGIVESALFPWLLYELPVREGSTVIGVWIGFKAWGNWKGWETYDSNARSSDSRTWRKRSDPHRGRRRMYAFLLCNVAQVLGALAVASLIGNIK